MADKCTDIPQRTARGVIEEYSNAVPYTDGEIFWRIRAYNRNGDHRAEKRWWARLSHTKQKDLQQLLRNRALTEAFDDLLDAPGLWRSIQLGQILDASTVEVLEGLAPQSIDFATIKDRFKEGTVFAGVSGAAARQDLLQNLQGVETLTPSLNTFFQNLKYLEPCCAALRCILPRKMRKTICQAFTNAWASCERRVIETKEGMRWCESRNVEAERRQGYIQLWLFAMRHFSELTNHAPRRDWGAEHAPNQPLNPITLQRFAHLASSLGFRTRQAQTLQDTDPFGELANEVLTTAGVSDAPSRAVHEVANVLRCYHRTSNDVRSQEGVQESVLELHPLTATEVDHEAVTRYGRPFQANHFHDQQYLYLDFLTEHGPNPHGKVTSLQVKRDILQGFLGLLDTSIPTLGPLGPEPTIDVPIHGLNVSCTTCDQLRDELEKSREDARVYSQHATSLQLHSDTQLRSLDQLKAASHELQRQMSETQAEHSTLQRVLQGTQKQLEEAQKRPTTEELSGIYLKLEQVQSSESHAWAELRCTCEELSATQRKLAGVQEELDRVGPAVEGLHYAQVQIDQLKQQSVDAKQKFERRMTEACKAAEARSQQQQDQSVAKCRRQFDKYKQEKFIFSWDFYEDGVQNVQTWEGLEDEARSYLEKYIGELQKPIVTVTIFKPTAQAVAHRSLDYIWQIWKGAQPQRLLLASYRRKKGVKRRPSSENATPHVSKKLRPEGFVLPHLDADKFGLGLQLHARNGLATGPNPVGYSPQESQADAFGLALQLHVQNGWTENRKHTDPPLPESQAALSLPPQAQSKGETDQFECEEDSSEQ
ncbi:MAG: hypothetical protein Q9162_002340 [Coniocarpon cinnabarinum]